MASNKFEYVGVVGSENDAIGDTGMVGDAADGS